MPIGCKIANSGEMEPKPTERILDKNEHGDFDAGMTHASEVCTTHCGAVNKHAGHVRRYPSQRCEDATVQG